MDRIFGNVNNRFKNVGNMEGKRMALKLVGFYAVGWTLRKLLKWTIFWSCHCKFYVRKFKNLWIKKMVKIVPQITCAEIGWVPESSCCLYLKGCCPLRICFLSHTCSTRVSWRVRWPPQVDHCSHCWPWPGDVSHNAAYRSAHSCWENCLETGNSRPRD